MSDCLVFIEPPIVCQYLTPNGVITVDWYDVKKLISHFWGFLAVVYQNQIHHWNPGATLNKKYCCLSKNLN